MKMNTYQYENVVLSQHRIRSRDIDIGIYSQRNTTHIHIHDKFTTFRLSESHKLAHTDTTSHTLNINVNEKKPN